MKLSSLLTQHSGFTDTLGCLPLSLGDGYLLQHNSVFRQVRLKALELGFAYSTDVSSAYQSFPMGQLEDILSKKTIPYVDNVTPLVDLNTRTSAQLEWDHVVDNLKPNYVFHESCHAVARSVAIPTPLSNPHNVSKDSSHTVSDQNLRITQMLIEESFANTCEFFAIAQAQEALHRTFLEMNSYFTVFEDRTHLKKAIQKHGAAPLFHFMFLCYLHSNFLNEQITEADLQRFYSLVQLQPDNSDHKALKVLSENVFALNPRFRYTTTEMYLHLNGINSTVTQALGFDYIKLIESHGPLRQNLQQLSQLIADNY